MSWQKPITNIIQKLLLSAGILCCLEEKAKVLKDILEQIVRHQLALHTLGQLIQGVTVLVDGS
jgi:hypothetical protein